MTPHDASGAAHGPVTVARAAAQGTERLGAAGIESARLDAELLVCRVLGWDRARLYAYPEQRLTARQKAAWRALLHRRERREPLPYLLGEWEFYGRSFYVNPSVLIPRPETELLVDGLLARRPWSKRRSAFVADVGTGSGCIGLTLAAEAPRAILILTDSSADALAVAKANADRLYVEISVELRRATFPDGLDDLSGKLDVLVSNPPYVAEGDRETLPPEVREFEPSEALYAGEGGLDLLRQLLKKGRALLRPGGWIALEFGIGQAEALAELAQANGYESVSIVSDLADIPRALFAQTPG